MLIGKVLRIGYISEENVPSIKITAIGNVSANADAHAVTNTTVKPLAEPNLQTAETNGIDKASVLPSIETKEYSRQL